MRNYRLFEIHTLPESEADELRTVIKYLEPSTKLNGWEFKGIWLSEYSVYLGIKKAFQSQSDDWSIGAIKAAFRLSANQQLLCNVFEYYAALKFIQKDFEAIMEKEKFLEAKDNDPMLIAAGIDRLNKYGDMLTVDTLARTYNTTWDEIGKWKYSKVYTILAMEKERGEIMKKYNQLTTTA